MDCWLILHMSAEGYSGGHATSLFAVSKATTAEED